MYIVAIALILLLVFAFILGKPYDAYPSKPFDDQTMDENKHDLVLPQRDAFPPVVPLTDITQPLLYPKVSTDSLTRRPPYPNKEQAYNNILSTDQTENWTPAYKATMEVINNPGLIIQEPPLTRMYYPQPGHHKDIGSPFGDGKVTIKLPQMSNLCNQIGGKLPPTFHLKGDISIHGTHLAIPAVDPKGYVIPHVYITSWNKYTGEVTFRNDITNWHGDFTLGYYHLCNFPECWEDELEVTKYGTYTVTI